MNTKAFIKVIPKDGGTPHILPEGNRAFYLAQGAKIETPTEAEILSAYPEIAEAEKKRAAREAAANRPAVRRTAAAIESKNNVDALKHDNQILRDRIKALEKENAELKAAAKTNIAPTEPATPKKSRGGRSKK